MCIPALKEGCITSTFLLCCLWLCKVKLIHSIHNLDVSLIFLHHKYFILFFFISAEAATACRTFLAQMQGPATDQMRGAVRAYSRWYVTQCAILGFGSCLAVSKAPFSYPPATYRPFRRIVAVPLTLSTVLVLQCLTDDTRVYLFVRPAHPLFPWPAACNKGSCFQMTLQLKLLC